MNSEAKANPTGYMVVMGGANIDYLARGPELPTALHPVQGDQFQEAPGGKGVNQAVAAARLGARVIFIGCVGADQRGERILARLNQEGVDTHYVIRDPAVETGVVLIQVNHKGQKQTLAVGGANLRLTVERLPKEVITSASLLLIQLEPPLGTVVAAARMAKAAGVKVILDPAPAVPLPEDLFPLLDVIRPDAGEAEVLTGIKVRDRTTAKEAADRLLARGVGAVGVEAGHEGNLVVWRGGESWNPIIPVKTIDTTGAGDAFAAGLAICLMEGSTLADAAPFANAAAALATTSVGALDSQPYRRDVERLLSR